MDIFKLISDLFLEYEALEKELHVIQGDLCADLMDAEAAKAALDARHSVATSFLREQFASLATTITSTAASVASIAITASQIAQAGTGAAVAFSLAGLPAAAIIGVSIGGGLVVGAIATVVLVFQQRGAFP